MTQKEIYDIALDLSILMDIASNADDPAETSNAAIYMVQGILRRYPKLRFQMYELGEVDILDKLNLDHGSPW